MMAKKTLLITLLVLVLALTSVASQNQAACSYPPCQVVPNGLTYYYPNWDDCSTYWICQNKQARKASCGAGQIFDFADYQCKARRQYSNRLEFLLHPQFSCDIILNGAGLTTLG